MMPGHLLKKAIKKTVLPLLALALMLTVLNACGDDMRNQPRFKPLAKTSFFEDGRASRPLVEGTVPQGYLREDDHLYRGRAGDAYATTFPFAMDEAALRRGQERYNIFCAVCHDQLGYGNGMVVQRGFVKAATFHSDRMRELPPGYFFDVITNGFGQMPAYASQIPPADRWAIAGYIRVLQESQNVPAGKLSAAEQKKLNESIKTMESQNAASTTVLHSTH